MFRELWSRKGDKDQVCTPCSVTGIYTLPTRKLPTDTPFPQFIFTIQISTWKLAPRVPVPTFGPPMYPAFPHRRVYHTSIPNVHIFPTRLQAKQGWGPGLCTPPVTLRAQHRAWHSVRSRRKGRKERKKRERETPTKEHQQRRADKQGGRGGERNS